jgi:hypothetical protein
MHVFCLKILNKIVGAAFFCRKGKCILLLFSFSTTWLGILEKTPVLKNQDVKNSYKWWKLFIFSFFNKAGFSFAYSISE